MTTKKNGYFYLRRKAEGLEKEVANLKYEIIMLQQMRDFIGERYVWLYEHAPWWLRWWFKHTFMSK